MLMSLLLFPASLAVRAMWPVLANVLHKELRRAIPSLRQSVSGGWFSTLCAWREECQDGRTTGWKQAGRGRLQLPGAAK